MKARRTKMGKEILFLLVLLLYMPIIAAEEFKGADYVVPPPPPDQQNASVIQLIDYNTNQEISNVHVDISIGDTRTLKYIPDGGNLQLSRDGALQIIIRADILDTEGSDYYGTLEPDESVAYMFPAGSLNGMVIDKDGSVVKDASVQLKCSANYGDTEDTTTDSYGSFSSEWLPTGSCFVYAEYNEKTGRQKVDIEQGKTIEVEIELKRGVVSNKSILPLLIPGLLGFLLIVLIIAIFRMKNTVKRIDNEEKTIESRSKDLIVTLNTKEKDVVMFLMDHENISQQNKIRHATGIPKTSLCRVFDSLERKKIIKVEKLGKMKKVSLTDFFLGKEENGP